MRFEPIGKEFVAPDGHTYKAERAALRGCIDCAFRETRLCNLYACMTLRREDHASVIFKRCENKN